MDEVQWGDIMDEDKEIYSNVSALCQIQTQIILFFVRICVTKLTVN